MRYWIIISLLLFPQLSFGEMVYFDIVSIDGNVLFSRSEKFFIGENGIVKNKKDKSFSLREIKLPARAKGDVSVKEDQNILNWVVLVDRKNNEEIPE